MRSQSGNEKKSLSRGRRKFGACGGRYARHGNVLAQRHAARLRCGMRVFRKGDTHQDVHVHQNSVQLVDQCGRACRAQPQSRERRNVSDIGFGNAHSVAPTFEVGLRHHERLAADVCIIKVNTHFRVTSGTGEFRNRARSEPHVTDALTDGKHRRVL